MLKSAATKPFPWKCGRCRERSVKPAIVSYTTEIDHDGRTYSVTVPDLEIPRCSKCGAMVRDDVANRRITNALRQQLGLLTPEQIRENREALGLTQKKLAEMLGIAEATLSRWETGAQIQQRAMDRLLRVTFGFKVVREALQDDRRLADLGVPSEAVTEGLRNDECSAAWDALAESVRKSLDALRAQSSPANRLLQVIGKRRWQEKEPEIVNAIVPVLWWAIGADPTSLQHWQSVFRRELGDWRHSEPQRTPEPKQSPTNRWFVARLHAEGPEDTDRAVRIARLVEALELLPREKRGALLDEFYRLLELLLDGPVPANARVIIDGYNLMHAAGLMKPRSGPSGLERARRVLLGALAASLGDQARPTTIFFDRMPSLATEAKQRFEIHGIHIEDGIDARIEKLIRREATPKQLTVVSSDARIQAAAKRFGAHAVDSLTFWQDVLARLRRRQAVAHVELSPHATSERDFWLRDFEDFIKEDDLRERAARVEYPGNRLESSRRTSKPARD